jgi:hypothetical protein
LDTCFKLVRVAEAILLEFRRQCGAASGVHSERTQGAARMP